MQSIRRTFDEAWANKPTDRSRKGGGKGGKPPKSGGGSGAAGGAAPAGVSASLHWRPNFPLSCALTSRAVECYNRWQPAKESIHSGLP